MTEDNTNELREELSNFIDAVEQHTGVSDVRLQGVGQHYYAELIVEYDPDLTKRQDLIQLVRENTNHEVESFDTPCIPLHLLIDYEQPEPDGETDG